MRDTFVRTLLEIAREDRRVLLLTGDLGFGVLTSFAAELPSQFLNVGVAEQNLAGLATGLALSGHIVFTYSIANFPTLRCLEQIRNDAAYHRANVKVVAIGAGFSYGALGISHHATEDLAIMRSLPDTTVLSPGDLQEAAEGTRTAWATPGTCYLRLDKSCAPPSPHGGQVVAGRLRQLRPGKDVAIIGTGGILAEALSAAETLAGEGVKCGVYSAHTIKPFDADSVGRICRDASLVVTLEEHTLDGGLGSAVAEACADTGSFPKALCRFGLRSEFSSVVGSQAYLRSRYGLDAKALVASIRQTLAEKRGVLASPR